MKKNLILKTLILTLSLSLFSPLTMASYATDTKKTESSTQGLPNINAQSAITIDLETGK